MGVSLLNILEHKDVTQPCDKVWNMFRNAPKYYGQNCYEKPVKQCLDMFTQAYNENPVLAIKCLFFVRDVRLGWGLRWFFKTCLQWLAYNQPELVRSFMAEIPNFGRWDDLFVLLGTPLEKDMVNLITTQLIKDIQSGKPSLLGKWMKSCNASSRETRETGNKLRNLLGLSPKQYRNMLSALRRKINLTETLISENQWKKIRYEHLPKGAANKYSSAFYRHDTERFMKSENKIKHLYQTPAYNKYSREDMLKVLQGPHFSKT